MMMLVDSDVRHWGRQLSTPAPDGYGHVVVYAVYRTLCGKTFTNRRAILLNPRDKVSYAPAPCQACLRTNAKLTIDDVVPAPNDAAERRAATLPEHMVEVEARVFRVQGSTNTYTVTIPIDPYLATLCTCMAGKVHPDVRCKHQTQVLNVLIERGEVIG